MSHETTIAANQHLSKAQKALPYVSIIASCASIVLIAVSLYSLHKQMKHTQMQMDKLEAEEKERFEKTQRNG